ncbi:glutamine synthetase III [Oscillibacter sp. MSJ-2]|uniref:Glutamine synthetase III n=1 Tax=Dysosmobacter acutus TaxID=2841504 RepID=A0ABS6FCD6_9FIRM|nr:glutamine synthetase III [Dysosmobacter acutus]MBU5627055.1 glutamine synthetase III [Dysosmobacter acutus]
MIQDPVNVPKLFGSMVFNEDVMKQRLSPTVYSSWKQCIADGAPLDRSIAHDIANAMKDWAVEKGATHFTHWFQPMTGYTAEKHDSFITPTEDGHVIMEFSGKELVRGESDASSFPSGGLRATFEARGYTAWDPTSFAFIKDGTLYIPTVFFSYSGQALDKKTPLLRSMELVSRQSVRILRLFGNDTVKKVTAQVGAEQEYFLVDESVYYKRDDLKLCGRTLFGAKPPKGQELDDHYYGVIRPRVAAYMKDLDTELWKLGVLSKTKHNEVAPAQHEMAPIYNNANAACDHNQLAMELMKTVAERHGLVCLLHEKPFAGVNGSGKHDNWSLTTDTGENLFKPGKTPSQNAQFLLFLAAFIKGVDDYQEMLRSTVASAGNDHRLGGNEAPPAIVSIFLGDELVEIIDSIVAGSAYVDKKKKNLQIGVDVLPNIPQDTTDRNRTSPLAFTGNKFEFRMLGSTQSIAGPNIVINTIMAEELRQFADQLENSRDFQADLQKLLRKTFKDHQRIIFSGNGYDESWAREAERRGLANLVSTADCLPAYVSQKNVDLFTKNGIFTKDEMTARNAIHLESYCKVIHIEALTLIEMVKRNILPAVSRYSDALSTSLLHRKEAVPTASFKVEETLISKLSRQNSALLDLTLRLQKAVDQAPGEDAGYAQANYYHDSVLSLLNEARTVIDDLETMTSKEYWPYPTYSDILFSV